MLRVPLLQSTRLRRPALPAVAPASTVVLSAHRFYATAPTRPCRLPTPPSPSRGLGELNEDRVARWCRRLWDITRQSADSAQPTHLLPRPNRLHVAQLKQMDTSASTPTATAATTVAAASSTSPSSELESMDVDALLARLQSAIRGDSGRIPGVIIEDVWAVFDLLVPPAVQDDVTDANITPEIEERFFAFVSTLNELDFDLQAVVKASKELDVKLDTYLGQLRQLEDKEAELVAARTTTSAAERANSASEFTERLMKAKGEVMRCCFQARNVGAPLYYTWLRHTASLADGLRRLMHFRKLAHHFESLCKKRIKSYDAQLKATAAASADAAEPLSQEAKDDLVRQQFKWRSRQIEVGLIDSALSLLFHDFFAKEYLVMEELTWYSTPPSLLDQIMRAESVHPFVRGLDDMRYRLQPAHHRHLFAFLHPAVVEEPLIAVQVALTHGIACSVDRILGRPTPLADPANTTRAATLFRQLSAAEAATPVAADGVTQDEDGSVNTAIFYSINSAQSALRGMDMGNRLIKRVVKEVEGNINASRQGRHLTPIHTFSTLSPIPLYVKWLAGVVAGMAATSPTPSSSSTTTTTTAAAVTGLFGRHLSVEEEELRYCAPLREAVAGFLLRHPTLLAAEAAAVTASAAAATSGNAAATMAANTAVLQYLVRLFQTAPSEVDGGQWWNDHVFTAALEGPLLRSVAVYLATVKRRGSTRISDPVGNFHVSNGATVYRLNFLGNTTEQGSRESACVMVNYWYDMPTVSANVTEYEVSQHVALGEPILALLGEEAPKN